MPRKPVNDHEGKDSLVPTISREEDRLKSYLDDAAAEARRIVKDAEQEAAARRRSAAEGLPALAGKRREELIAAARGRADQLRAELTAQARKALAGAEKNCDTAASLIVREVWPGGGR